MVHNEIDSLPASRETGQQTYDSFIICPCPCQYAIRPKAFLPFSLNLILFFRRLNPAPFLRRHNPMPLLRFLNPAPIFAILNPFVIFSSEFQGQSSPGWKNHRQILLCMRRHSWCSCFRLA